MCGSKEGLEMELSKRIKMIPDTRGQYSMLLEDEDQDYEEYARALEHMCNSFNRVAKMEAILRAKYGINWETRYEMWKKEKGIPPLHWVYQGQDTNYEPDEYGE